MSTRLRPGGGTLNAYGLGYVVNTTAPPATSADSGLFEDNAELPITTFIYEIVDEGLLLSVETGRLGRTTTDTSDFVSVETAIVDTGLNQLTANDAVSLFTATEIATVDAEAQLGVSATDSESTFNSTETATLVQLDPLLALSSTDSGNLTSSEITALSVADLLVSASDLGSITGTEGSQIFKTGTAIKASSDVGNFFSVEIPNVTKPKYAFDFDGGFIGTELFISLEKIQYDPAWEDDEATWGGASLGSKSFAPIFIQDNTFAIFNRSGASYVNAFLERRALLSAEGAGFLGKGIYPQVKGAKGTVLKVSMGGHDEIDGAVDWEGPYDFVIGEDTFVDFEVEGQYLAVRFESEGIPNWKLLSYRVEYENLPGYL